MKQADFKGAEVARITAGSPAAAAGIKVGEHVQTVNGVLLTDYIAWLWESDGCDLSLEVVSSDAAVRTVQLRRDLHAENAAATCWGIAFDGLIYDGIHTCDNNCSFCFMRQLPPGVRPSLNLRDDDWRLSFFLGNFITLTNLTSADKQRIVAQRVSPLRVSFHASDEALREQLLGKNQARGLKNLDQLIAAGIDFHIQIVLLPGVNDGAALEQTLQYLGDPQRRDHIRSVGIVPLAFTDYAPDCLKQLLNAASCAGEQREAWSKAVIEQVQKHQFAQHEQRGMTWVYLADEFYIHANAPFPLPQFY
ncbi:MAG: DUF512 domain-containing protein, partial [Coriobacteriia bacterium]|nr:DUF512 domain-containing protein [Coriobacteriia bacterium]